MDLTTFRVLWRRCEVAAITDGLSRKIVGPESYHGTPNKTDLVGFVDCAIQHNGSPRYIITDHGGQFQTAFYGALAGRGIKHVRGRVQSWQFNAKIERLFWSLKRWGRLVLIVPDVIAFQDRLDAHAVWHNLHRPHAAVGTLTPSDAARGLGRRDTIRYMEGGELEPES